MKNTLRILMIPTWYSDYNAEQMFAGIFHYEQSMALKQYCDVALFFPYDFSIKTDYQKEIEHDLLTYRSYFGQSNEITKGIHFYNSLRHVIKDFKPNILHMHCASKAGYIVQRMRPRHDIACVITEHTPIEMLSLDDEVWYKRLKYAYSHSDANVCVSKDFQTRISKAFPQQSFELIHNGIINPNTIKYEKTNYRVRRKVNCCIVGGFYSDTIKGYQYLLPALSQLVHQKREKIFLHIVGGGEFEEKYKAVAKELHLEKHCKFYGHCDRRKTYTIINQMDFNISASEFECSGVSVQEAQLIGKPLVVTKSGGANSLVIPESARVVERKSVEALVEGIQWMTHNFKRFDSDVIKEFAYKNFDIENVTKQYLDLYEKVRKSTER